MNADLEYLVVKIVSEVGGSAVVFSVFTLITTVAIFAIQAI